MNATNATYQDSGERQADECDVASARELADTAHQVRRMQAKQAATKLGSDFDGEHCVDCDEVIPDGRLKALAFHVPTSGEFKVSLHETDKAYVQDGINYLLKHGTDKCVDCQSKLDKVFAASGKQYA